MFYEKKNDAEFFEKIAHETKKQTEAKSAIKHTLKTTTLHTHTLYVSLLCFSRLESVPFKTQSWGETTLSLLALSLFFSSLEPREKEHIATRTPREEHKSSSEYGYIITSRRENIYNAEERFESKETWGKWRNRRALSTRCACSLSSLFFKVVFFVSFFFFLLSLTAFSFSLSLS